MQKFTYIAISWIAFMGMFTVNGMANYLPINGLSTGAISNLYPNLFVPDGFTFSIWSVIYLWLLIFLGYATKILIWLPEIDQRYKRIVTILPLFWLTCVLNAVWIICWHYLQVLLSLGVMLMLLVTLIIIFKKIKENPAAIRKRDHLLVEVPFIIYLGWISVATIANTTALLVHAGWAGAPLSESTWSIIMMAIAGGLAIWMSVMEKRPAFALVVCWALWGIYRGQGEETPAVGMGALIVLALCLALAVVALLQPKKTMKKVNSF